MYKQTTLMITILFCCTAAIAEEGMWTLDNFPKDAVSERYGVEITDDWLNRARLATARLEGGCSGSFASENGLVVTNHHCITTCLTQLSTAEQDLEAEGFYAAEPDQELRCEAEQVSVLIDTQEITAEVLAAANNKDESEANKARKATLTRLEKECEQQGEEQGQKVYCESVNLYNGGQYFMYTYKRYEDVRMVFVPEADVASFGGDPDNFNFPRWSLDMAFLRVYENDQPALTPDFLPWRADGADADELVMVSGHPGSTERLLTVAQLQHVRDMVIPNWLLRYSELRGRMIQLATQSEEDHRIVRIPLQSIENSLKVFRNQQLVLMNDEFMAAKKAREDILRSENAVPFENIEVALATFKTFYMRHLFIERTAGLQGDLFNYARTLVRAAMEREKPDAQRLRAFVEPALPGMKQRMIAARPIYPVLERQRLAFSLDKMRELLGPDDPFVKQVLGNQSPDELAAKLVGDTQLADPDYRELHWVGGIKAIETSDDPMIQMALAIDAQGRALRKRYEDEVEAVILNAEEQIAKTRFETEGTSSYPDATFTLRVTYGSVKGWLEQGEQVAPFTTTQRLYDRTTGSVPFRLPKSWIDARRKLNMESRFNQSLTTDITGGNSGSPIIDQHGNFVGLIFDGNIHSIGGDYWFDESLNRSVAVHPQVMLEALDKVYGAERLLQEITLAE